MSDCQNCNSEGDHQYCPNCGEVLTAHRISLPHLLHEVAHTFIHFEKGFLFTLRELALRPGKMQKRYLEGVRLHYQKPFPLFAISTTVCALLLYLIYHHGPNQNDQYFYKHYYFIVQAFMLPCYGLITFVLFKDRDLYYAEALVLNVYMLAFMSVMILPLNILSYFVPPGIVSLLEITCLVGYNVCTNLNFFRGKAKGWIVVKSVISIIASYLLFQYASMKVMEWWM
jgi:hypothetical protein